MQIKISEIVKAGGYNSDGGKGEYRILKLLELSEKYKDKITQSFLKGDYVEGEMDEILEELKYLEKHTKEAKEQQAIQSAIDSDNEKQRQEKRQEEASESNASIKNDIDKLLDSLPIGAQYYEYKTIVVKDSEFLGFVDADRIEMLLNRLALHGWRLKAAITNEVGHNRAVVVNATINNTILILERLVTKE